MGAPVSSSIVLGVIQGITEFLPISSDGHLALAQLLLGIEEGGLTFSVMLHAGTLFATLLVLRGRVAPAVVDGTKALVKPSRFSSSSGGRDALVVICASLPTAVIGLVLRDAVERWTHSPMVIGLGFLGTAAVVFSTRFVRVGQREVPSVVGAILIGLCQGLAVLPGLSRSGSTIAAALWLKVRPDRAFDPSRSMSLPLWDCAHRALSRTTTRMVAVCNPTANGRVRGLRWSVCVAAATYSAAAWRAASLMHAIVTWVAPLGIVSMVALGPAPQAQPTAPPSSESATLPNRDSTSCGAMTTTTRCSRWSWPPAARGHWCCAGRRGKPWRKQLLAIGPEGGLPDRVPRCGASRRCARPSAR